MFTIKSMFRSAVLCLFCVTSLALQAQINLDGDWEGTPQGMPRMILHVVHGPGCMMISPDQGTSAPAAVFLNGTTVSFQVPPWGVSFSGIVNGNQISGTVYQGPNSSNVVLVRASANPPMQAPSPISVAPNSTNSALLGQQVDALVVSKYAGTPLHLGLQIAVSVDGKQVFSRGYGSAKDGTPINAVTPFAIGSITKTFTAAAILKLSEAGKLHLAQNVFAIVPTILAPWPANRPLPLLTIEMHLNQTAGAFEYLNMRDPRDTAWITASPSGDQLLSWCKQHTVFSRYSAPGSFHYSNTHYLTLGWIIETVTGDSYGRFINAEIFKPLHLSHTSYGDPPTDAAGAFRAGTPIPPLKPAWAFSAGGIYSTADDLISWAEAFANGQVVSANLAKQATSGNASYGYGWEISNGPISKVGHNGLIDGYQSELECYQLGGHRIVVAVLASDEGSAFLGQLTDEIAVLFSH